MDGAWSSPWTLGTVDAVTGPAALATTRPVTAGLGGGLDALVARAREGDEEAFEALMAATQRRVTSLAYRLLGNLDDARDATQETYVRVYRFLGKFRQGEDFGAWLYRITVNVCHDHRGRRRPAGSLDELVASAHEPAAGHPDDDPEDRARRAQQAALLSEGLKGLSEKERAALVLRDLEGIPTDEVAALLGSSPTTVRSQISVARKRLRAFFEGRRP